MKLIAQILTLAVLIVYGHAMANAWDAGYYWLFPVALVLTVAAGYALQTPQEKHDTDAWFKALRSKWPQRR